MNTVQKAQGERLRQARVAAGYRSARAAAVDNGWPVSSYSAHEKGRRTIGMDDAERYARRLRQKGASTSGQYILYGAAAPAPEPEIRPPSMPGLSDAQALVVEHVVRTFLKVVLASPALRERLSDPAYQGALAVLISQYAKSRTVHEAIQRGDQAALQIAAELQLERTNDSEPYQ